jgi:hypothetical protein
MAAIEQVWTAGHVRLAAQSSVGVDFVVPLSVHYIQSDQPTVVASAIAEVVSRPAVGGRQAVRLARE